MRALVAPPAIAAMGILWVWVAVFEVFDDGGWMAMRFWVKVEGQTQGEGQL